ncbi:glutathione S-transferase [Shewanella sp. 10N.286.52.B9]|uniref:glutathione S-transferase n=1 Tax=Shewanella sp. 10N.286.52.B9 TaxID=1880837 RepID=UPI000C834363|nr:glutathione S-transferase [Shewanella sp. 10N.286.52.B9]PMG41022.1 glutathione S-transferase [Shewanella sp. 10N.286.52.B9]
MNKIIDLPVLYSLRNCPFAMRARIAIYKSNQPIWLRDIVLSDKPAEMLAASPKATVPVIVTPKGQVIEESYEVMLWALSQSDPDDLLFATDASKFDSMLALIYRFDSEFKSCLENYKCAKRYSESNIVECRLACEVYLQQLELLLSEHEFLFADRESLADIALLPFIRQFARVERQWYLQSPYPHVRAWLNAYLQSKMFSKVMTKYPLWLESRQDVIFPD